MLTAFDVKYGKPNPEPYLIALKKGGFKPNEPLVIEHAPLAVQAGVAAGIFTIAVNTGPLHDLSLIHILCAVTTELKNSNVWDIIRLI